MLKTRWLAKFCLTPLTLLLIWNYLILFCLNRKMTFADWRFQIFKNNKGTLMVLILLVYISISFCSNFLYAQICRCRDAYSSVINHVLIINYVSSEPRMFTIYNLVQPASQKNWYSISVWLWSCGAVPSDLPSTTGY